MGEEGWGWGVGVEGRESPRVLRQPTCALGSGCSSPCVRSFALSLRLAGKSASEPGLAFDLDASSHCLNQTLDYGQTEPRSSKGSVRTAIDLL